MEGLLTVELTVNGQKYQPDVSGKKTLLEFLREDLRLTGTKNGCNSNHCGACTVLVDGKAVKSCHVKMVKLQGAHVVTIEGLAADGSLHPIQEAFLAAGAVQCGFCTPGMILKTKELLDRHPDPSEREIRLALKDNICRCTGYLKIIAAVKLAAKWTKESAALTLEKSGGYGRSVIDLDGGEKVCGSLLFADDLYRDGVLYAKVVWAAYPFAKIKKIDTAGAEELPGVVKVLTASDVPGHNGFGPIKQDQPVLCDELTRFAGDAVALVLAENPEAAAEGAKQVKVDYEVLPGVYSPQDSLRADAPKIHEDGNICKHLVHSVGDVGAALESAELLVEGHFETPFVEHAYLEPEAGIAFWEDDLLVVKAPTQFPFELRSQLSKILLLEQEQIRVQATPLGGGFGGKADATVEPLIALGAFVTGKPVKLTLTREESLKRSTKRHPYVMDYRVGLDREGKILAVDAKLLSDAGAYTNLSPRVIDQACIFACGPYEVPNLRLEGWAVYTNNVISSAFRGFGINQAAVAIESLLDEAARKLAMDPFELRLRNALKVGSKTPSGEILKAGVAMEETIAAAQKALAEALPSIKKSLTPGKKLGIGVAAGFKNVGAGKGKVDDAGAIFTLLPGGKVKLRASAIDMGQGIRTTLAQITREIVPLKDNVLEVITGDTMLTPKHGGAIAERQTLISGNAVVQAAMLFKEKMLERAAEVTEVPRERLRLSDAGVEDEKGNLLLSLTGLEQALAEKKEQLEVSYNYIAPRTFALADVEGRKSVAPEEYRNYPSYAYTCQVAAVEVDPQSGEVKVVNVLAAHDVGKAINPQKIEGQIEGSCLMAQGYALSEEFRMKQGVPASRSFRSLKVPTIMDAPPVKTLIVEKPDPNGPLGAKGISEVATVPLTPAILNAIYDAVGVRIYSLPAVPAKILNAGK